MEVDMLNNNNAAYYTSGDYTGVPKPRTETSQQIKKGQQNQSSVNKATGEYSSEIKLDNDDYDISQAKSDRDNDSKKTTEMLDKAIQEANKKIVGFNREFHYSVHERTKQIMIKIVDTNTNEVLREIPPQKALDAVAKMWELAGILVDEKR